MLLLLLLSQGTRKGEKLANEGGGPVRVGYCVNLLVVGVECGGGIAREYRGAIEDVANECGV